MSAFVLGIPETKLRIVAPDVGGGFGSKSSTTARRPSSPAPRSSSAGR